MELLNATPFAARLLGGADADGAECAVLVAKATYAIGIGAEPVLAEEQREVELADAYTGEPGASSIRAPSDLCIGKPGTDLGLVGSVQLGDGQLERDLLFQVGSAAKRMRVTAPRRWETVLGRARIGAPLPSEAVELGWEQAYGGADDSASNPKRHGFCEENPIGRGYRSKRSKLPVEGELLPAIEDPAALMRRPGDQPRPWCPGFVAPGWLPRRAFAGTYDDRWQRERSPLLPEDFDPRFHDRGSASLVAPESPRGGDEVRIAGAVPEGDYRFALPVPELEATLVFARARDAIALHCDTVLVDLDARELVLSWSGHSRIQGRIHEVIGARLALAAGGGGGS